MCRQGTRAAAPDSSKSDDSDHDLSDWHLREFPEQCHRLGASLPLRKWCDAQRHSAAASAGGGCTCCLRAFSVPYHADRDPAAAIKRVNQIDEGGGGIRCLCS